MYKKSYEISVGLFVIFAALAFIFLAFKVSGLSFQSLSGSHSYKVTADFDDIGALNKNAAVRIAGVQIGKVDNIALDDRSFQARVTLNIDSQYKDIPEDSSAAIETSGILGDSFISIEPGYGKTLLKNGSQIQTTYSATNLSSLISTFASGEKSK